MGGVKVIHLDTPTVTGVPVPDWRAIITAVPGAVAYEIRYWSPGALYVKAFPTMPVFDDKGDEVEDHG